MHTTHHAWLCESPDIPSVLTDFLSSLDTEIQIIEEPVLRIDTVRGLIATAHTTSLSHATRTCILVVNELTHESQNALLKLFEEPPAHTSFYLVIPTRASLIPTLQSRLQTYDHKVIARKNTTWEDFKEMLIADQLAEVASKTKAKDTQWQNSIIQGAATDTVVRRETALLLDTYFGTRGASAKMLLEALVLSLHDGQKSASTLQ